MKIAERQGFAHPHAQAFRWNFGFPVERRKAAAEQLARTLNSLVQSVRRISEHSLQILRWLRHHLRARSTLEASLSDAPAYFFSSI